jgi:cytochrome P450
VPQRKHQIHGFTTGALQSYLPPIAGIARSHMQRWAQQQGPVDLGESVRTMVLDFAFDAIMGLPLTTVDRQELLAVAADHQQGLFEAPINLPGTKFYKAKAARARGLKVGSALFPPPPAPQHTPPPPPPPPPHAGEGTTALGEGSSAGAAPCA